jgi:hypothetical protein
MDTAKRQTEKGKAPAQERCVSAERRKAKPPTKKGLDNEVGFHTCG